MHRLALRHCSYGHDSPIHEYYLTLSKTALIRYLRTELDKSLRYGFPDCRISDQSHKHLTECIYARSACHKTRGDDRTNSISCVPGPDSYLITRTNKTRGYTGHIYCINNPTYEQPTEIIL